ncbi:GGDEF domain-containing protein [Ferrimonas pelagia]|uniref:diguanylate cyclase n=1 Tax=Ferrimonas pelagia TaxID=1177826 RepID=A0ABP9EZ64_9GAMM
MDAQTPPRSRKSDFRTTIFRIMLLISMLICAGFAPVNWIAGRIDYALIETVMALYCLVALRLLPHRRHLQSLFGLYLILLFSVIIYGIARVPPQDSHGNWLLLIPAFSYLLLGRRHGRLYTAIFLTIALSILLFRWQTETGFTHLSVANTLMSSLTIWLVIDVFERQRINMTIELEDAASRDPLTGLFNRLHLKEALKRLQASATPGTPFALVLFDLDHFKKVNDQYGHPVGDAVLKHFAQQLQSSVRNSDLAFRIGGEEFSLLLPNTDSKGALKVANKIRQGFSRTPYQHNQCTIPVTVSGGIANWPEQEPQSPNLYECADRRLYLAKTSGRDRIINRDPPQSPANSTPKPSPTA